MNRRHCLAAVLLLFSHSALAREKGEASLTPEEQEFVELLTDCTLVGTFSVDTRPDAPPKPERYSIQSVSKQENDAWIVNARIVYGENNVMVPVPVQVKWAGDTPVLQVTDLTIPLLGSQFTARVMFYGDHYAGTWKHGKVGGHMWGRIEASSEKEP